jgi:hypothetical protein
MAATTFEIVPLGDAESFDRLREIITERSAIKPRFVFDVMKGVQVGETSPDDADKPTCRPVHPPIDTR